MRPGQQQAITPPPGQPPAAQGQRPPAAALAIAPVTRPVDPKTMPQHLEQLRTQRQEVQEGNRTVIRESDRVIIREGGHDIIRHDEAARFAFNAREVNVERRGNATVTVALRPDGSRIVTEVDDNGRLLRRVRRDAAGREIIIIDNTVVVGGPALAVGAGLAVGGIGLAIGGPALFIDLAPPVIRIAPELYIRETVRATPDELYLTLAAPPVERIDRRYSLDEIRYSEPLRARMPQIDIDTVNFEFGSWEITPDQVQRLAGVAQGIRRAVERNPAEVFLIEGHTDAVGNDVDNLSLSDRRAEIGCRGTHKSVRGAAGKPHQSGLRQAVPQDPDAGAGTRQPPRRGAPHHAAADRPELRLAKLSLPGPAQNAGPIFLARSFRGALLREPGIQSGRALWLLDSGFRLRRPRNDHSIIAQSPPYSFSFFLRWPSVRSRSALRRMKPAASRWS